MGRALKTALPEVDVRDMDHEAELAGAYEQYRAATLAWRAAAKAGHVEAEERTAERLITARVALYRGLLATGWRPPAPVEVQLDRDVALVSAPTDFDALLAV